MDEVKIKLKALLEGLECEDIDNLIAEATPEVFREAGKRITKLAKCGILNISSRDLTEEGKEYRERADSVLGSVTCSHELDGWCSLTGPAPVCGASIRTKELSNEGFCRYKCGRVNQNDISKDKIK